MSTVRPRYGAWPTTAEEFARLKQYRQANKARAKNNPNEREMALWLKKTGIKFARQKSWGFRIYDFWNSVLGIAVEVDGPEHNAEWDRIRDQENYTKSGIVVLRVRNKNSEDAIKAIEYIKKAEPWWERRKKLGLKYKEPTPKLKSRYDGYKFSKENPNPNWANG